MYKFIVEAYDYGSEYEQLKSLPGTSDYPRAKITKKIFENFIKERSSDHIRALEIGPGSGFITEHLSEVLSHYNCCELDLMDFSDGFLKNTAEKEYRVSNFICHDISKEGDDEHLKGKYDIIFFQEVLEHLVSPFSAMINIRKMLKDDGVLFVTIPNSGWWPNFWMENVRTKYLLRPDEYIDTHISEISTTGLVKLSNMSGYDVLSIEYYCSKYNFLKSFFSEQVGLVLIKGEEPETRWRKLALKNKEQYFKEINNKVSSI
jgi:2-polyprenyl-3-methyl-5-hydroxy-6-metoxy-1,4-benzoquinol methylase